MGWNGKKAWKSDRHETTKIIWYWTVRGIISRLRTGTVAGKQEGEKLYIKEKQ